MTEKVDRKSRVGDDRFQESGFLRVRRFLIRSLGFRGVVESGGEVRDEFLAEEAGVVRDLGTNSARLEHIFTVLRRADWVVNCRISAFRI